MTRNHGFWRVKSGDYSSALTSCDQESEDCRRKKGSGEWSVKKFMAKPV